MTDIISNREKEVIHLISLGYTDKEIGARLFISPYTVGDHRRNIKLKMNCPNAPAIVRRAFELGLLSFAKNRSSISYGKLID